MSFYVSNCCGHQFVKDIQPCPDCGESKGMKLIDKTKSVNKPQVKPEVKKKKGKK